MSTVRSRAGDRATVPDGAPDGVRWRLVVSAGVGVGVVVALLFSELPFLVIDQYATFLLFLGRDSVLGVGINEFASFLASYAMPALYLLLVVLAASWVGRRVRGGAGPLNGILVGVVSGVVSEILTEIIDALYLGLGAPGLMELLIYPVLAVGGGLVGGLRGFNVLAGREVLYEASGGVRAARSPEDVATAVGEHLAGSSVVGVTLWEVDERASAYSRYDEDEDKTDVATEQQREKGEEFVRVGSWTPPSRGAEQQPPPPTAGTPTLCLSTGTMPALGELLEGRRASLVLRVEEMPAPERRAFEGKWSVRSVLFVALFGTDGALLGMLSVASHKRRGFSRSAQRAYLTLAAPVALALENLKLLEEARRAGLLGERRRLSHEIHDTLAQGFTSIVMNLEAAEGVIAEAATPEGEGPSFKALGHLDQARRTARESLAEARRLVWALRPKPLAEASLGEALNRLAEGWSEESGTPCHAAIAGTPQPLAPEVEVTLLRVAQEALANARKHARASRAALTLSYIGDVVALDARDDGAGFEPKEDRPDPLRDSGEDGGGSNSSGGFGLKGMRERVERLGGTLSIESAPGEGTTLVAELPVALVEGRAAGAVARAVAGDEPGSQGSGPRGSKRAILKGAGEIPSKENPS